MMTAQDEYRVRFLRFAASCILLLGMASLAWALYVYAFYPVDPTAIFQRIVFCLAMICGGFVTRVLVPSPSPRQPWLNPENAFLGSRLDGLILFGSIPAFLLLLFIAPFAIANYRNSLASNDEFVPVKVRVESINIKHVSAEQLPNESYYPIYKEVYYIPEKYHDLWVAFGDVTLFEKDGQPVEPTVLKANFTVPHSESYGSKNARTSYIEHYKMNAVIDSERFDVGKTYQGWLLREHSPDVLFSRPSDLAWKDLRIVASLASAVCIYLIIRISIGMKRQDKHWRDMKEIWTSDSRQSARNQGRRS